MGYRVPRSDDTLTLEFQGEHEGLEVRCKADQDIGTYFQMRRLAEEASDPLDRERSLEALLQHFADSVLLEWNLEDENGPVPATFEGLQHLPVSFVAEIAAAWIRGIGQIARPLEAASNNGSGLPEESIPTEELSLAP